MTLNNKKKMSTQSCHNQHSNKSYYEALKEMYEALRNKYWANMKSEIIEVLNSCEICQRANPHSKADIPEN